MIARFSLALTTAYSTFVAFATRVLAQDFLGQVPNIGGGGNTDFRQTILDVLGKVLSFMALIAVVMIVIAGIRLVVAGSDEGQRDKAKNMVFYAIIGLIIIILASAIVSFVADTLGA